MSREIKFRGLNSSGEFVYGLPSKDLPNSTAYYDKYSYRICWHPESGVGANQPIKNGTLGQFTGLLDKNGVEIYEGDILSSGEAVGVMEWNQAHNTGSWTVFSPINRFEVIGNIYENPELLK